MPLTDGLDVFRALLNDDCICADGEKASDGILKENNADAKLKKLTISELGKGMLLLAMDEGRKRSKTKTKIECMSPLFRIDGEYNHNRVCDAILLRKIPNGDYDICYIELKSDKPTGFTDQFKSTECFIEYLCNLAEVFCKHTINISRSRYVVLHTDSNNVIPRKKTSTRLREDAKNTADYPKMMIVRDGATIRFSELQS